MIRYRDAGIQPQTDKAKNWGIFDFQFCETCEITGAMIGATSELTC